MIEIENEVESCFVEELELFSLEKVFFLSDRFIPFNSFLIISLASSFKEKLLILRLLFIKEPAGESNEDFLGVLILIEFCFL